MGFKRFLAVITLLVTIITLHSCGKQDLYSNDPLIGTWVYDSYLIDSNFEVYTANNELDPDRPGMIFKPGGKLVNRTIFGWCATPPVSYENYQGSWEYLNDSTVLIRYEWWGTASGQPDREKTFKIVKVDEQSLWIQYIF